MILAIVSPAQRLRYHCHDKAHVIEDQDMELVILENLRGSWPESIACAAGNALDN